MPDDSKFDEFLRRETNRYVEPVTPPADAIWARELPAAFDHWVLFFDTLFVCGYAIVLSFLCAWAFALAAGLRTPASPRRPWLNLLGRSMPYLVLGDLTENLLHFLALMARDVESATFARVLFTVGSLGSVAKLVGLAGVVALLIVGVVARIRLSARAKANASGPGGGVAGPAGRVGPGTRGPA